MFEYNDILILIGLGNAVKAKCSFCNTTLQNPEAVSSHKKKCLDKPIKCPDCGDIVALKSWYDHNCQMVDAGGIFLTIQNTLIYLQHFLAQSQNVYDFVLSVRLASLPELCLM